MNKLKEILQRKNITIQFVGDSITWGLNHCTLDETYVAKFALHISKYLKDYTVQRFDGISAGELEPMKEFCGPVIVSKRGSDKVVDIIKNGIGGNTVMRALNRINDFTGVLANGLKPDITFLMFGINDSISVNPDKYVTPAEFKSNYAKLINEILKRNPDTFIIMLSATTNDFPVDLHCEASKELASERGINYIDLHAMWMKHFDKSQPNFGHGDWLSSDVKDACHLTPLSAEVMAEYIFEQFVLMIEE